MSDDVKGRPNPWSIVVGVLLGLGLLVAGLIRNR